MKKIISLFARNYDGDKLVWDEVVPGAEWVLAGEGRPSLKWDGTCCLVRGGVLYKRYDAKAGKKPPPDFEAAQEPDPVTGHWPGWVPVGDGPDDKWHRSATIPTRDGTYELLGPKVQGNPENFPTHLLMPHGDAADFEAYGNPRTFADIRSFFGAHDMEGIVWRHDDGRMVKIKAKDFGIARGPK